MQEMPFSSFARGPMPLLRKLSRAGRELTLNTRVVLFNLICRLGQSSYSWPTVKLIADDCGISERATQYALRELEHLGFLEITPRAQQSSLYRLRTTALIAWAEHRNPLGAPDAGRGANLAPEGCNDCTQPVQDLHPPLHEERTKEDSSTEERARATSARREAEEAGWAMRRLVDDAIGEYSGRWGYLKAIEEVMQSIEAWQARGRIVTAEHLQAAAVEGKRRHTAAGYEGWPRYPKMFIEALTDIVLGPAPQPTRPEPPRPATPQPKRLSHIDLEAALCSRDNVPRIARAVTTSHPHLLPELHSLAAAGHTAAQEALRLSKLSPVP